MTAAQPKGDRTSDTDGPATRRVRHDFVMLGILATAILLFVSTGSTVLTQIARQLLGYHANLDRWLASALILNIALIIFGWRRYSELRAEVAERRDAAEAAFHLAHTDPLTGCLNRRNVHEAAGRVIERAREQGHTVVAMMFDLDMFKRINDVYGHRTGDAVLVETTRRIRNLLPDDALLARLGGDEFACVVELATDRAGAADDLAERMIAALAAPINVVSPCVEITTSIGLARAEMTTASDPEACAEELLHMADLAMYQAKKRGRNCFLWFERAMAREMKYRSELERGIRDGIGAGEFVPYYEQQIDLATGALTGFEMLARWNSPQLGLVNPDLFIPIAEEIGVIAELSETLIARALLDAREWDPSLTLSVNISPIQLRDPWFAQKLLKLLVAANFPPNRLEIEITESCLHENLGVVRSLVTSLKNQGVKISLDDFGTGYSSLAQLRALPFDRIKIDRSFIATIGESAESRTIVQAIASLGLGMNLPIVAEGIESAAIADQLRGLGPIKGQGFLYGRPADAQTIRQFLAERKLLATADPASDIAAAPAGSPIARSA